MDRRPPSILLVEPDPFERLQLTRMLRDSGYGVTPVVEPDDAVNIFVVHHRQLALVMWRARILGAAGDRMQRAMQLIDSHVPVLAIDHHTHGSHVGGHCLDGESTFAEILASVRRVLTGSPASTSPAGNPWRAAVTAHPAHPPEDVPHARSVKHGRSDDDFLGDFADDDDGVVSSQADADAFAWPMPDEEIARIESDAGRPKRASASAYTAKTFDTRLTWQSERQATFMLASAEGDGRFQPIATQDLRDYIAAERKAHLTQQHRLYRIAALIGVICALFLILFFGKHETEVRAVERDDRPVPAASAATTRVVTTPQRAMAQPLAIDRARTLMRRKLRSGRDA